MGQEQFIIADITWNRYGWRNIYVDPRAGHRYAQKHPGHESLNFDFDKKNLDTARRVFGYFKWTNPPRKLGKGVVVFFYSKNLDNHTNQIVGVYGNAEILDPPKLVEWKGFGHLYSTVSGDKRLSLLFPIPLNADRYSAGKRLVGQTGFRYIDSKLAERIIVDEIIKLKTSAIRIEEYKKLSKLYRLITGNDYVDEQAGSDHDIDAKEQQELERKISNEVALDTNKRLAIIEELKSISPSSPERVGYHGHTYKRDNKTIAQLKIIRGSKCQFCNTAIRKKNGELYVEAAHIKRKSERGPETPSNILILCPNHHKELDLGDRKIIERTNDRIVLELNGKTFDIDLQLK
jgi:hypothetical protein